MEIKQNAPVFKTRSKERMIARLRKLFVSGRSLHVTLSRNNEHPYYRIRIVDRKDGNVWEIENFYVKVSLKGNWKLCFISNEAAEILNRERPEARLRALRGA